MCTRIRLLFLIHPFISSFFFLSNYQTLKFFVILFPETVRPRRLKLGTHVNSGQMYRVSLYFSSSFSQIFKHENILSHFSQELWGLEGWNLLYMWKTGGCILYTGIMLLPLFIPSFLFFFLSSFQTLKIFVTLFSGTVRPRWLKLGTRLDSGKMYYVYQNQAAAAYSSLYFSFFFLSNIQIWNVFVTLSSGTVRPRRLKLVTHVANRWMYLVYWNHAAALICPFIFIFLSLQFSNTSSSHFSEELWGLEGWKLVHSWKMGRCIMYTRIRLLLLIHPYISSFFFLPNFQTKIFCLTFLRNCEA